MKETIIETIEDLEGVGKRFESELHMVFRGQNCAKWELKTSLERHCDRLTVLQQDLEPWILKDFTRQASNFIDGGLPRKEETIDWLSLMQHHGAPSRLLDFTRSFWIALFFAFEKAESDFAVFCVNLEDLRNAGAAISKARMDPERIVSHSILGEELLDPPLVFTCLPKVENKRFFHQQGHFLAASTSKHRFHDVIVRMDKESGNKILEKFVMRIGLQHQILYKLKAMNISTSSLMPGLDGYTRSLCNPTTDSPFY